MSGAKFANGDHVEKISGSSWRGRIVGTYSTDLTREGYAVESDTEKGSVQIYPAKALRLATPTEDARARVVIRARVHQALAAIEHDTRVTDLTDAEIDTIIAATTPALGKKETDRHG